MRVILFGFFWLFFALWEKEGLNFFIELIESANEIWE